VKGGGGRRIPCGTGVRQPEKLVDVLKGCGGGNPSGQGTKVLTDVKQLGWKKWSRPVTKRPMAQQWGRGSTETSCPEKRSPKKWFGVTASKLKAKTAKEKKKKKTLSP